MFGLLFLHNNLHAAHHADPTVPWYRLPAWYRRNRAALVAANGGLVYDGYLDVARRFLLATHDTPAHPQGRAVPTGLGDSAGAAHHYRRLELAADDTPVPRAPGSPLLPAVIEPLGPVVA